MDGDRRVGVENEQEKAGHARATGADSRLDERHVQHLSAQPLEEAETAQRVVSRSRGPRPWVVDLGHRQPDVGTCLPPGRHVFHQHRPEAAPTVIAPDGQVREQQDTFTRVDLPDDAAEHQPIAHRDGGVHDGLAVAAQPAREHVGVVELFG